jgi:hypothetical protein
MRVAGQAPATATARRVFELQAKGEETGEYAFDKRLAVAKQLYVARFVLKIDGDGPVFAGLAGCGLHGHPQVRWSRQLVTKDEGNVSQFQEDRDGVGTLPLKSVECENNCASQVVLMLGRPHVQKVDSHGSIQIFPILQEVRPVCKTRNQFRQKVDATPGVAHRGFANPLMQAHSAWARS